MPSPFSTTMFSVPPFTASGQTSAATPLGEPPNGTGPGGSWSVGAITLTGVALSTATFGMLGSADGGVTYEPIAMESLAALGTFATTFTATAAAGYRANLAGLTHVKFVTSGTFTATSVSVVLTAAPNGQ